jgi:Patatin-like phospholipase
MNTPLSRRAALSGFGSLSAFALGGCGGVSLNADGRIADPLLQRQVQIPGLPDIRVWGDEIPADIVAALRRGRAAPERLAAFSETADGRPLVETLALSGGGADGAFGAGVLNGWTARGTRPQFHIVTGVSAGALIAPLAFIGAAGDETLRQIWTGPLVSEVLSVQGGLFGGSASADDTPLASAIAKFITTRMLRDIAREYHKGRLLLVGTTNLDAQRPVVWNLTALAASGHPRAPDLFRRIIQASASIPALFPPVPIEVEANGKTYKELHVDGGTTRDVFVTPFPVVYRDYDKLYPASPKRRFHIINNGKISPEASLTTLQTLPLAGRAISTLLKSQHLAEIALIYKRSLENGADFNLAAVPADFSLAGIEPGSSAYQAALFEAGVAFGRDSRSWLKKPPNNRSI